MNNACCDVLCNLFKKRSDIHSRLTRHANLSFYILPCCSKVKKDFIVNRGLHFGTLLSLVFVITKALMYLSIM